MEPPPTFGAGGNVEGASVPRPPTTRRGGVAVPPPGALHVSQRRWARPVRSRSVSVCVGLILCVAATHGADLLWEAEDLARSAVIHGGGDLLVFSAPSEQQLDFSGGRAVSFVPRGKNSAVEFVLTVPEEGVYQLAVRGVAGPSCGIYNIVHGQRVVRWVNFSAERTVHTNQAANMGNGVWTKRMLLEEGENRVRFVFSQYQRRGGTLVLDTLQLIPARREQPPPEPDPYETVMPEGETRGPNLVTHPGFEAFGPQDQFSEKRRAIRGWQFNSAVPTGQPTIVRGRATAHSGEGALHLVPDPLEDNAIVYHANMPARSGHRYRVAVHARGSGSFRIDFYQYGGSPKNEDAERTLNVFAAKDAWQMVSFVMSPSRSGQIGRVAITLCALEGADVWFDDIAVYEILDRK